jgi:hypothetical protein
MTSRTWFATASYSILLVSLSGASQAQPLQFRSDLQVRDLDGKTANGKLYVGAAKQRMEFTAGGETRPTITDPANGTQNTISPGQRKYMEMPLGESGGPVRIPRLAAVDPANPCASGELSDCMRLGAEMLNGYATQKWQYTNVDGESVTAWIASKLRFPIKTVADNGATNELRNVVEGAQAANLFAVPAGYAQVDDLGTSVADVLASVDPALIQKALAAGKQLDAANKANPVNPARVAMWEAGPGYVMNLTVTMKATANSQGGPFNSRVRSTIAMRYSVSIPMNYGAPGVPPTVGPQWSLLPLKGSGSPQAEARPVTMALEWEEQSDIHVVAGCEGIEAATTDETVIVKGKAAASNPITQSATQGFAQALMQINGALTSYSFIGGGTFSNQADVVTTSRLVDHCAGNRVTNKTTNMKPAIPGQNAVDIKDVPLPPTPAGLKGSRTMPWRFNDWNEPATIEWNIVPIPR